MPKKWRTDLPPDSFPLSFHKAISEIGVHMLKEGLGEREVKKVQDRFSMFRACLRASPRHPNHKFLAEHCTRTRFLNGILWCHTTPNPLAHMRIVE